MVLTIKNTPKTEYMYKVGNTKHYTTTFNNQSCAKYFCDRVNNKVMPVVHIDIFIRSVVLMKVNN